MIPFNHHSNTAKPFQNNAAWIWSSEGTHLRNHNRSPSHYEVRRFRKTFELTQEDVHQGLRIHVTGDTIFHFFLNGEHLLKGPAPGDIRHHFFDVLFVSKEQLQVGTNTFSAIVFDTSDIACHPPSLGAPAAMMTHKGGFLLEAFLESETTPFVVTDNTWKIAVDHAYHFVNTREQWFGGFVGYFEARHFAHEPKGWTQPDFDDSQWEPAKPLYKGVRIEDMNDADSPYGLIERIGPRPTVKALLTPQPIDVQKTADPALIDFFKSQSAPITVPANSEVEIILELETTENGYPQLSLEGGNEGEVRIGYSEALRLNHDVKDALIFGRDQSTEDVSIGYENRNEGWTYDPRGKFEGYEDILHLDSREHIWQPFHWRSAKFIRIAIKTESNPLTLKRFVFIPQSYPLNDQTRFHSSSESMNAIYATSLHTLRLSIYDTFMDCPYFEQLQYIGDSALNSEAACLVDGAYAITKQLLLHFEWSRLPDGWTQSRYPSRIEGVIPSQSLDWITAIHNYTLYSGDIDTARRLLPGIQSVLNAYERCCGDSGLPENLPYWNWIDWCPGWKRGVPPGSESGPVLSHCAKYAIAVQNTISLCDWLQEGVLKKQLQTRYQRLRIASQNRFWNASDHYFCENTIDKQYGSRLGNALALLAGFEDESERSLIGKRLASEALPDCSFFGYYFVRQALWKVGYCDFHRELSPWKSMCDMNLSTFAEDTTFWRSLCHGWSANPIIDMVKNVLGIQALEPGFATVRIEPKIDTMESASGAAVTPHGLIEVKWYPKNEYTELEVTLPRGVEATLTLQGETQQPLTAGTNTFEVAKAIEVSS